jgi:hypothetical protein
MQPTYQAKPRQIQYFVDDGQMGRWADGQMGRWADGQMGRHQSAEDEPSHIHPEAPFSNTGMRLIQNDEITP